MVSDNYVVLEAKHRPVTVRGVNDEGRVGAVRGLLDSDSRHAVHGVRDVPLGGARHRHENRQIPPDVEALEDAHHLDARARVEMARRLVSQQ